MFSILNRLVYKNEIVGLRILVECSEESGEEEILDLDMDLVYKYEIDYEGYSVEQLEVIEIDGIYATEDEHSQGIFIEDVQDFYKNRENFIKDIYENFEDGNISMGIRFEELTDCEYCPFRGDSEYCYSSADYESPCIIHPEFSFRELQSNVNRGRYYEEQQIEKEQEKRKQKEKKDKIRKAKAQATRIRNRDLTSKINDLRKQKKAYEEYLSMRRNALSVNKLFGYTESKDEITGLNIYEEKIREIDDKIEVLISERNNRNKSYR